jgi:MarR family transcriptional regulator, organic hydroperoxide resistance regulator
MAGKLQHELGKRKPFECAEEEAFLSIIRTADVLARTASEMFKPHDLSPTQYNVLRILRGTCPAGTSGLACGTIADQMLTRDPDMTRLLDRLEKRGLISRSREEKDRRVVRTCITDKGLDVLKELDPVIADCHRKQLGHMSGEQLRQLIELLEVAREKAGT